MLMLWHVVATLFVIGIWCGGPGRQLRLKSRNQSPKALCTAADPPPSSRCTVQFNQAKLHQSRTQRVLCAVCADNKFPRGTHYENLFHFRDQPRRVPFCIRKCTGNESRKMRDRLGLVIEQKIIQNSSTRCQFLSLYFPKTYFDLKKKII